MHKVQKRGIHILLIEDSAGDARLLIELLKESSVNTRVDVAKSGDEAFSFLHKAIEKDEIPEIIILDLKLPGMSGHQILQNLKADSVLRHIPVIVLSSSSDESDIIKSYDLQASCYITKPNTLDRYEEAVNIIERFWFELVKLPA